MGIWYEVTPLDTLFFRGSEPMEAGQLTADALFLLLVTVIQGAVRTAVLKQEGVSFQDYNAGREPSFVRERIGQSGTEAPFQVIGILFRKGGRIYAPAPAAWFVDLPNKPIAGRDVVGTQVRLPKWELPYSELEIVLSSPKPPVVTAENEAFSLAGSWVDATLLAEKAPVFKSDDVLMTSELFQLENRVGIAMNEKRKVEQGALYSSGHIRLREDMTMLVGLSKDLGLQKQGRLQLGGEQRVCSYQLCASPSFPSNGSNRYCALSPVQGDQEAVDSVLCSQKPVVLAGWDMDKGFHKPSQTWLQAGSVFSKNIKNVCIALACD